MHFSTAAMIGGLKTAMAEVDEKIKGATSKKMVALLSDNMKLSSRVKLLETQIERQRLILDRLGEFRRAMKSLTATSTMLLLDNPKAVLIIEHFTTRLSVIVEELEQYTRRMR